MRECMRNYIIKQKGKRYEQITYHIVRFSRRGRHGIYSICHR